MIRLLLVILLLAAGFLPAYAQERQICEESDLYDLTKGCPLGQLRSRYGKDEVRDIMFEVLKDYPYDQKDRFAALLERKIDLLKQGAGGPESWKAKAGERLAYHLERVRSASAGNWDQTRDAARKELASVDEMYRKSGERGQSRIIHLRVLTA